MREWISVKQKLPFEDHILYVNDGRGNPPQYMVGYFNRLTKCWMVDCTQQPGLPVTHFQELPAPPTVEPASGEESR